MTVPGRTQTLTVVTPLVVTGVTRLRLEFAVSRLLPRLLGITPLRSVYATRWSVVTAAVDAESGEPRPLRPPCLFWETTFSAAMEPYIESFLVAIGRQIGRTWGSSVGFPGVGSVTRLTGYLAAHTRPAASSWSAYPDASVRMVLSALEIAREHDFLVAAAATCSPEEFAVVYDGFLRRRQGDL